MNKMLKLCGTLTMHVCALRTRNINVKLQKLSKRAGGFDFFRPLGEPLPHATDLEFGGERLVFSST